MLSLCYFDVIMGTEQWGAKLRQLRHDRDMTQDQLATKAGIKRSALAHYELGIVKRPSFDLLSKLATALGMTTSQLSQEVYGKPMPESAKLTPTSNVSWPPSAVAAIPIIGTVPAGSLDLEEQEDCGLLYVPEEVTRGMRKSDLRALLVSGNCLSGDDIFSGDFIVFNVTLINVTPGSIYVCRTPDGEVTLKHVHPKDDHVLLKVSNPDYKDIEVVSIEILGKVVFAQRPPKVYR